MKTVLGASKIFAVTAVLGLALAGCGQRGAGDQTSGASGGGTPGSTQSSGSSGSMGSSGAAGSGGSGSGSSTGSK